MGVIVIGVINGAPGPSANFLDLPLVSELILGTSGSKTTFAAEILQGLRLSVHHPFCTFYFKTVFQRVLSLL